VQLHTAVSKCIVYGKLFKPRQSFRITLYFKIASNFQDKIQNCLQFDHTEFFILKYRLGNSRFSNHSHVIGMCVEFKRLVGSKIEAFDLRNGIDLDSSDEAA